MTKRLLVLWAIIALLAGALAGCGRQQAEQAAGPAPRRQIETVKPNEDDGAIYRATEEFVKALAADDRQKVLSLLTADHRNSWRDDSFLFKKDAKSAFDAARAENIRYTVVNYQNNEDTGFQDIGVIFVVYDIVLEKDGKEASRVKMQDNLLFRKEAGQWLIAANERLILTGAR